MAPGVEVSGSRRSHATIADENWRGGVAFVMHISSM